MAAAASWKGSPVPLPDHLASNPKTVNNACCSGVFAKSPSKHEKPDSSEQRKSNVRPSRFATRLCHSPSSSKLSCGTLL
eukprot:1679807-Lingulodinium_polyedra.AAC.1